MSVRMKKSLGRKLAGLLCLVMVIQTMMTGMGGVPMANAAQNNTSEWNEAVTLSGTPKDAFSRLTAEVATQVRDGNILDIQFSMELYAPFLEAEMETFMENGGLGPMDYEPSDNDGKTYEKYLMEQPDDMLPQIEFTCTLSGDVFDASQRKNGSFDAGGETVAAYSLEQSGKNLVLRAVVPKSMYNRYDVDAVFTVGLELNHHYDDSAQVSGAPGTGDVDVTVTVIGDQLPESGNSDYTIVKKGEKDPADSAGLVWTITAETAGSDILKAVKASGSNAKEYGTPSRTSPSNATKTSTYPPSGDRESREPVRVRTATSSDTVEDSTGISAINGTGTEADLAGLVISDAIPEGLYITEVKAEINSGGMKVLDTEAYQVSEKGVLTYKVPTGEQVKKCVLKIYTRLDDKLVNDHALSGTGAVTYEYSNRAELLSGDDSSLLAVSKRANKSITLDSFLDKVGSAVNSSQKQMKWTLNVKPRFSHGVQLYMIDHLEDVTHTHQYILNGDRFTVTRQKKGGELETLGVTTLNSVDNLSGASGFPKFEELKGVPDFDKIGHTPESNEVLVYTYDTGKEISVGDSGDKEPVYDSVMIIPLPFDSSFGDYSNGDVEIVYYTDTTVGLESNTYAAERELVNEAKAVWQWPEGEGPGADTFGGLTVSKNWPVDYRLVSKKGGNYDYPNNIMTWNFEVNQYRTSMSRLKIVDTFDKDVQIWAMGREPLVLTGEDGSEKRLSYLEAAPGETGDDGPYSEEGYTITEEGSRQIFTLYLGAGAEAGEPSIKATDVYEFTIQTKLAPEKLKEIVGADGGVRIENEADITAVINGREIPQKTQKVYNEVKNPLIDKRHLDFTSSDGSKYSYDFKNNTVKWGITVNQNSWTIADPVITDELPEGTSITPSGSATVEQDACAAGLVKAMKGGESGTIEYASDKSPAGTVTWGDGTVVTFKEEDQGDQNSAYQKKKLTFKFTKHEGEPVSIEGPYYFEFNTEVEEQYRKDNFKSNGTVPFSNQAEFSGNLSGTSFTIQDMADAAIKPYPVTKRGLYFDEEKEIGDSDGRFKAEVKGFHWQVLVNRTAVEMKGAVLTDEIQDCMELLPGSLKVYKVDRADLSGSGTLSLDYEETHAASENRPSEWQFGTALGSEADERHFKYQIPDDFGGKDLMLITFDTVLVADAVVSEMTNKITITQGETRDETDDVQGEGGQNFHLDDYAHAKGMYYIKIKKTSVNKKEDARYPLEGAVFEVTQGENDRKQRTGGWTQDTDDAGKPIVKTRTTNSRGDANIIFLKPDKSYKLEEIKAPDAYQKLGKPVYISFETDPATDEWKIQVDVPGELEKLVTVTDDGCIEIQNRPITGDDAGKITFKKKGLGGAPLAGVEFRLTHKSLKTPAIVSSDTDGAVTFAGLDVSDSPYYIEEAAAPEGYKKMAGKLQAVVSWNSESSKCETAYKTGFQEESDGTWTVKNDPVRGSGSFQKVDQNGDPVTGLKIGFEVARKNDGLYGSGADGTYAPYEEPDGSGGKVPKTELSSDKNGRVEFKDFLCGDYKITEKTNSGLHLAKDADPFYIHVDEDGTASMWTEADKKGAEIPGKVANTLQYGILNINKLAGETDPADSGKLTGSVDADNKPIPIAGAVFSVYRAGADGNAAGSPFITLKTNEQGNFEPDQYGFYTDASDSSKKKQLVYGTYVLKETSVPKDADGGQVKYELNTQKYPFEIKPWSSGSTAADSWVWINSNEQGSPTYGMSEDAGKDSAFYNALLRDSVTVKKVNQDLKEVLLSGAEFGVLEGDGSRKILVAMLKHDSTYGDGIYKLKPVEAGDLNQGSVTYTKGTYDGRGRKYLEAPTNNPAVPTGLAGSADDYRLLYGNYTLVETKVPDKYHKPVNSDGTDKTYRLTVGASVSINGSYAGAGGVLLIGNEPLKGSLKIEKYVEKRKATGSDTESGGYERAASSGSETGFQFRLEGRPDYAPDDGQYDIRKEFRTGPDGTLEFKDIPLGTYTLTETGVSSKYLFGNGQDKTSMLQGMKDKITVKIEASSEDPYQVKITCTVTGAGGNPIQIPERTGDDIETQFEVQKTVLMNSASKDAPTLYIANRYETGKAEGVKVSRDVKDPDASQNPKEEPMEGVEFQLWRENDKQAYVTAKTDDSGKFAFTEIPYGVYTLKEVCPDGYLPCDLDGSTVTVSEASLELHSKGSTNTIVNQVIRKSLKFSKADQNGDAIGNGRISLGFEVEQIQPAEKAFTTKTFHNDENGTVTIENLSYGKYKVAEINESSTVKVKPADPFYISVEQDSQAPDDQSLKKTKITMSKSENGDPSSDSVLSMKSDSADIYDFTARGAKGTKPFVVTNELPYGRIIMNKKVGEKLDAGGTLGQPTGSVLTKNLSLKGMVFDIYKKGETTPYIGLETGENGHFTDENGLYTDCELAGKKRYLLYGEYELKERPVGDLPYVIPDHTYSFTIAADPAGDAGNLVTEVGFDSNYPDSKNGGQVGQGAVYGDEADKAVFYNEPKRGAVTLQKVDGEIKTMLLSGADFDVYTADGKDLVARLAEKEPAEGGTKGSYVLQPVRTGAVYRSTDTGVQYLVQDPADGSYKLLYGDYQLKETKAPAGYQNAAKPWHLTVGKDITVKEENGGGTPVETENLKNDILKGTVRLQKYIQQRTGNSTPAKPETDIAGYVKAGTGFKFRLERQSDKTPDDTRSYVAERETDGQGTLSFENVPLGVYKLTETDWPDEYKKKIAGAPADLLQPAELTVILSQSKEEPSKVDITYEKTDGSSVAAGAGTEDFTESELLLAKGGELLMANAFKMGTLTGKKYGVHSTGTEKKPLSGVTFGLYQNAGDHTPYLTAVTDDGGTLRFEKVPYGSYTLREIAWPDGYLPDTSDRSVVVNAETIDLGDILNGEIRKTVKFAKVDQNGDPVGSGRLLTQFSVEKLDSAAPQGSITVMDGVVNTPDGVVVLANLAYGKYRIVEKDNSLLAKSAKPFYLEIRKDSSDPGQTTVLLADTEDMTDAVAMTDGSASDQVYDFTGASGAAQAVFKVANELKSAQLSIKKAAADTAADGSLILPQNAKPLSGVVFAVYRDQKEDGVFDPGEDRRVLTLTTDADGQFKTAADGRYLDEADRPQDYELVYGHHYLLKEEGFAAGSPLEASYQTDENYYAFSVMQDEAGQVLHVGCASGTVALSAGKLPSDAVRFVPGEAGAGLQFPNKQLYRAGVVLTKTDADLPDVPVSGAKLAVYTNSAGTAGASKEAKVAVLTDGGTGIYRLAPGTAGDGCAETNSAGQYYLKKSGNSYELMAGSYYVKEEKAPLGYETPKGEDGKWYFTIGKGKTEITNADLTGKGGEAKVFSNGLYIGEVEVSKEVDGFQAGSLRGLTDQDEFRFVLKGTPSNATYVEKTGTVDKDTKKAVFNGVPGGRYILYEDLSEEQKTVYVTQPEITVTVSEDGVVYETAKEPFGGTVRNRLKRGSITGRKETIDHDGSRTALRGAEFTLTKLDAAGKPTVDYLTAVSGKDGSFRFEEVPVGTYSLKETKAPDGFEKDGTVYTVAVTNEKEVVTEGANADGTNGQLVFTDEAFGSIILTKRAEFLKDDEITGTMQPGEGFRFAVTGKAWDKTPIEEVLQEGNVTGEDVKLEPGRGVLVTAGTDGKIVLNHVPAGDYEITEVQNGKNGEDGPYVLDVKARKAVVSVKDHQVADVDLTVTNRLKRASIKGMKTEEDGRTPLAGAVIGLFEPGTEDFVEEKLWRGQSAVSGEDGVFLFENIPAGTYLLAETKAPDGYSLNRNTVYEVTVKEEGTVLTRAMLNGELTDLVIKNDRVSSADGDGGGGGGGDGGGSNCPAHTNPAGSTEAGPGMPTTPAAESTAPGATKSVAAESSSATETSSHQVELRPGRPVVIPVPDVPPDTPVIIQDTVTEDVVFRGRTDADRKVTAQLTEGSYELFIIDDEGVPLSGWPFEVVNKLPDAGDHAVPAALLAAILLSGIGGVVLLLRKRKELKKKEEK